MSLGKIVLFGSGETSPMGGQVFRRLAEERGSGVVVAMLETPAGFQPNSAQVMGTVADFFQSRIQHLHPTVYRISARKRGTENSPDNADLVRPIAQADIIYLGAGSPTYAVRQLQDSLAWQYAMGAWEQGASLLLASAAAIAVSSKALPVYEIFKAGEDPHWKEGLNLFGSCGLDLAIVPHWNNNDGGAELDTSRCFIGEDRFRALRASLPESALVLGIDEHTVVEIDLAAGRGFITGPGKLTVLGSQGERSVSSGGPFPLSLLGDRTCPAIPFGIPDAIWQEVLLAQVNQKDEAIPSGLTQLLHERNIARSANDYDRADELRRKIEDDGWEITDTKDGPRLTRWTKKPGSA